MHALTESCAAKKNTCRQCCVDGHHPPEPNLGADPMKLTGPASIFRPAFQFTSHVLNMTSQTPLPTRVSRACDRCRRNKSRVGYSGVSLYVVLGIALIHTSSSATLIGRARYVCVRTSTALQLAARMQCSERQLVLKQVRVELERRHSSSVKQRRIVGNADGLGREMIYLLLATYRPRWARRVMLS